MKDYYIESYKVLKDSKKNPDNIFLQLRELSDKNPEQKITVEIHLNELAKHNEIIKRICNLRDKFYAHLDKEYEKHTDAVPVDKILRCFEAIEKAIATLTSDEILHQHLANIPSRNNLSI